MRITHTLDVRSPAPYLRPRGRAGVCVCVRIFADLGTALCAALEADLLACQRHLSSEGAAMGGGTAFAAQSAASFRTQRSTASAGCVGVVRCGGQAPTCARPGGAFRLPLAPVCVSVLRGVRGAWCTIVCPCLHAPVPPPHG
jgi:hypothetical protein